MAISKKTVEAPKQATITIEQWANLYESFYNQIKALEKQLKPAKEALVEYANTHRADFENNKLRFPNGVYVEIRERFTDSYDEDLVSLEWINKMIESGGGKYMSIKLDTKALGGFDLKNDAVVDCLKEINYDIEIKESLAVCTEK